MWCRAVTGPALVVATIGGVGRGSSSSPGRQQSAAVPAETNAATETQLTTKTVESSASTTIHIDCASHDGWHYLHDFPYPDFVASFSKDISQAPPAQANLAVAR
jgi:hypothetical protein